MALTVGVAQLPRYIGQQVGVSEWIVIDQARIDRFAAATGDHQYIHVDPQRAAGTPFGTTIAHGFLTLSLLVPMSHAGGIRLEHSVMEINYGFDKLRFIHPVKVNNRIRGCFQLCRAEQKALDQWLLAHQVNVAIQGEEKPALVAQWLTLTVVAPAEGGGSKPEPGAGLAT